MFPSSGLPLFLWETSGYVGASSCSAGMVWAMPEGHELWKGEGCEPCHECSMKRLVMDVLLQAVVAL